MIISEFSKRTGVSPSTLRYQGESTMGERLSILYRHRRCVAEQQARWVEYAKNLDDKIIWYEKTIGTT